MECGKNKRKKNDQTIEFHSAECIKLKEERKPPSVLNDFMQF